MARFCGEVGFAESQKTAPGIWEDVVTVREYYGDVLRDSIGIENATAVNSTYTVNNSFSIMADDYALAHIFAIRFVRWGGTLWEVSSTELKSPRLILRVGGVYNGKSS